MALRLDLDTFQHYDPGRSASTVNVWLAHPSPSEEAASGKLLVLSSFDRVTRVNHEIIALIQEELRSVYYQTTDVGIDRAFERTLVQVNQRLHEAISAGVQQWVDGANILVVAIKQQTLLAAHVGQVHAYIVRRERLHPILSTADTVKPNALRMFGHVVSGQIEPGDRVLFCTTSLLDYFSLEKVRRLLIDFSPSDVVRQMEATLLSADSHYAVAAIAIEASTISDPMPLISRAGTSPTYTVRENAPQASMDRLLSRQHATEQLLTPSVWPAIRDVFQSIGRGLSGFIRTVVFRRPPRRTIPGATLPTPPNRPAKPSWAQTMWSTARSGIASTLAGLRRRVVRPRLSSPAAPLKPFRPESPRQWLHRFVRWITALRRPQQLAIALVLITIVSLSAALSFRGHGTTTTSTNTDLPSQIRQYIAQAQAALLYGGDVTAQQAIATADELYDQLPHRSKADKATQSALSSELAAIHLRVDHVNTIANPTVLATLGGLPNNFSGRQLYHAGSTIVVADPEHNQVATMADRGKPTPTSSALTLDTGTLTTGATLSTSALVFGTNRQTFVHFNVEQRQWKPLDSAFPQTQPRIQAISSYLNRVYVLDTNHQQIIRFSFGGSSLGRGVAWLQASASLSAARQLAVDGSIFVLQPGAKVQEFLSGRLTSFALSTIHPTLTDATRLWTDVASTHLYVLDPNQRRVVVFDKDGRLVDQYSSPQWTDLRDVTANEKTKTLYVLNGSTIHTVTLVH